jgi:thiamine-monophosphate kinase
MEEVGREFDCPLVGGDTGSWDGRLVMVVSIIGRCDGVAPVLRSGARAGDRIYVSGPLGGSILGRHLEPVPRIGLARELASRGLVRAMMDLSDGLSRDLPRICAASGVGATIEASRVPIHEDVDRLMRSRGETDGASGVGKDLEATRLNHALDDGEDYELLIIGGVIDDARLIEIGRIDAERGVRLMGGGRVEAMKARGWEHRL